MAEIFHIVPASNRAAWTFVRRPTTRTIGTAIPGYRAGWFRLVNGSKPLL
jgi:hypothetical protein